MLVRKQILIKDSQANDLTELAQLMGISESELHRRILDVGLELEKKYAKKIRKRKLSGAEFLLMQAKKAVAGPGDSEYDKYAYDL
jgi:hypothetical protein